MTSRSAVSSPKRYSLGPATISSSIAVRPAGVSKLVDGGPQAGDLLGERALHRDDDAVGADGVRRRSGRPPAPDTGCAPAASVLEAAGLTLGAVDDARSPRGRRRSATWRRSGTRRRRGHAAPRRRARRSCRPTRASGLPRAQRPRQHRRSHPATQRVVGRGRGETSTDMAGAFPARRFAQPQDTAAKAAS